MKLFDLNSPLMVAMGKLADVIICNIMFCLFSLPVITIGASLTALYHCMQGLITDDERDEGMIIRDFWRAFRENFKQATVLWLICLLMIGFLFAYYWVTRSLGGAYARVYQTTFYALVLVFLVGFIYIFPLQARYRNEVRYTLRNAWLLSVAALPWTLLALAIDILFVYVTVFMKPDAFQMAIYIWAVCGFGILAYLNSFIFKRAFRKLSPEQLKPKSTVSEGAVFTDEEHMEEDLMVQESSYSDPNWNRRDDLFPPEKKESKRKRRRR
jgi:uncharacterized membrane protein YesL